MKGCIINYDKTSLIEVFDCINDFDKCNCLITNIECCPADREISEIMDAEYCWIDGKELLRLFLKSMGMQRHAVQKFMARYVAMVLPAMPVISLPLIQMRAEVHRQ